MWLSRCDVNDKATLSPHLLLNLTADLYATLKTSHFSQLNLYKELYEECQRRGFAVTDYSSNFTNISSDYFNDYNPTIIERKLLIERITERLSKTSKSSWHYFGNKITKEEAIKLLIF